MEIAEKVEVVLKNLGVQIIKNAKLIEIIEDGDEGLESVVFNMLDIVVDEEDDDDIEELEEKSDGQSSR